MRTLALTLLLLSTPGWAYVVTIDSGPGIGGDYLHRPGSVQFQFSGIPTPEADGLLTVSAFGDIGGTLEYVRVDLSPGGAVGFLFGDLDDGSEPIPETDSLSIPLDTLLSSMIGDTLTFVLSLQPESGAAYVRFDSVQFSVSTIPARLTIPEPSTSLLLTSSFLGLFAVRALSGSRTHVSARAKIAVPSRIII